MIKKLRKKFIYINMFFVASILSVVLGSLVYTNQTRYIRNTNDFLKNELWSYSNDERYEGPVEWYTLSSNDTNSVSKTYDAESDTASSESSNTPPIQVTQKSKSKSGGSLPFNILPSVSIKMDSSGNILDMQNREFSIDNATATIISKYALSNSDTSGYGIISDYKLRYLVSEKDGFTYIIFADYSFQQSSNQSFLITCILIFILANILFLILSYYLSRWALTPAEKSWRQQSQFVADASHELRTPITVILANIGILESHKSDTILTQQKWVKNTRDEATRMKQLIEDLLFLAKSDANIQPLVLSKIDMTDCITGRVLNFESLAFEKDVELISNIKDRLVCNGNEGQIKQLLTILLDNACKYAGTKGLVSVKAYAECDRLFIHINNTGEPIAKEEILHIFERFYRTDKSRVRKEGGYGLGLAIAYNIVTSHRGKISVTSNIENGTTFTVELPVK